MGSKRRLRPLEKRVLEMSEEFLRYTTGKEGYTGTVAYGQVYNMLRSIFPELRREIDSIDEKLLGENYRNRGLI